MKSKICNKIVVLNCYTISYSAVNISGHFDTDNTCLFGKCSNIKLFPTVLTYGGEYRIYKQPENWARSGQDEE